MKKLLGLIVMTGLSLAGISQNSVPYEENGKYGFKNDKGEVIVVAQYDHVGDYWGKITCVKKDGKWGYITKQGDLVTALKYDSADEYYPENDRAWVLSKGKAGFIDGQGKEIIAPKYDNAGTAFAYAGLEYIQNNHKFGLINWNGAEVVRPKYDSIDINANWKENRIPVQLGTKWGYIDTLGNVKVPCSYDEVSAFELGYAAVKLNGKAGFIDPEGKVIIQPAYDAASDLVQYLSLVRLHGKWGVIDTSGRLIVPVKYEHSNFIAGDEVMIALMENNKWGVVNTKGETVLEVKYDSLFVDRSRLAFKLNGRQGYLKNGQIVWNEENKASKPIMVTILIASLLGITFLIIALKRKNKITQK